MNYLVEHELVDYTLKTFKEIKKHIEERGWRCNVDLDDIKIDHKRILNFSWNRSKKFNRRLNLMNEARSVRSLNIGFHFLFKRMLETDNPVKIKVSEKEELIQSKRKKWKEARDLADQLLKQYKEEKGDFYKKQM